MGLALLISPLVGFSCAALLLLLSKALIKNPDLYRAPKNGEPPPPWIRGLLILTCTGVSFAHGSNDGQKGMGLIMLILIGILPVTFAVNLGTPPESIAQTAVEAQSIRDGAGTAIPSKQAADELTRYLKTGSQSSPSTIAALSTKCNEISAALNGKTRLNDLFRMPIAESCGRTFISLLKHWAN